MSNKWEDLFNDEDSLVRKLKVTLNNNQIAYRFICNKLDVSDMLFIENALGEGYIPIMTNFKTEKGRGSGDFIVPNTIEYDFIHSIRENLKEVNQKTGKVEHGNLSIIQWYFSISIVKSAIKYQRKRFDMEVTRQFGKTHVMTQIAGFLPVFAPLYADLINDRWWQIIASYTEDSVEEIFDLKTKPVIFKNIELFNRKYPRNQLVYGRYEKETYVNTKMKLEIRRLINNIPVPYSYIIALSTNKVSDGKSADWMWLDESWRTNDKEFRRGILPFAGSTGADIVYTGISTIDVNNMMYYVHFKVKNAIRFISDIFVTYNFLLHDNIRRAENLRSLAEEEFDSSGIESAESQTNYLLSWDTLDGKFYSYEWLRKNKNYSKNPCLQIFDNDCDFRVAGLDLATINDYCVLSIFDVYVVNRNTIDDNTGQKEYKQVYKYMLREIITYNLDKIPMSAESVAQKTAQYCKSYEIDMILCDGTTSQRTHNEWILKELKNGGINTQLCPYDFAGDKNKILLMSNYEQVLNSGLVQFGTEEEIPKHTSADILINEIVNLYKGFEKGKRNLQFKAKGRSNTDDHVMSTALGVYCLPFIQYLIRNNKDIEINSYRYKPKLNKFRILKQEQNIPKMPQTYMIVF